MTAATACLVTGRLRSGCDAFTRLSPVKRNQLDVDPRVSKLTTAVVGVPLGWVSAFRDLFR